MNPTPSSSASARASDRRGCSVSIWVLLLSNLLVFQLGLLCDVHRSSSYSSSSPQTTVTPNELTLPASGGWNPNDPLAIPQGSAENLPSIRVQDANIDKKRKIYGGAGDKAHLGGFTDIDVDGLSPSIWTNMILQYGVHSLLDVGCGRGISTRWFLEHKVDVLCVEGSHDAVEKSFLPSERIVEHDYSRGPWWPAKTYDAVW